LNRKLLRQVHVPRLLLASAGLVPGFAEFGVYCACAVLAVVYYYVRVGTIYLSFGRATLLVPAGIALTALLGAGTAVLIAGFGRRARDMRFALSYLLGFMYFMTPVIYPLSSVPNKWRPLAELNPLTGAMEMVKHGLFASETFSLDAAYVTLIATALIWGPGLWLVHRRELRLVQGGEP
jgi:lipopolysaccharide transport system permease protein